MYSHDGNLSNNFRIETAVTRNFVWMVSFLDRMFAFEEDSEDLYFSANLVPTDFTNSTDAGLITIGAKGGARAKLAVWVSYHGFLVVKISERSWDPEMYINGFVAPYEAVETYVRGMLVQQAENEIEGKSRHMSAKDRARVDMSLIKSKK